MVYYIVAVLVAVLPIPLIADAFAIFAIVKTWGHWGWTGILIFVFVLHGSLNKSYMSGVDKGEITKKEAIQGAIGYNIVFCLISAYAINKFS